MHKTKQRRKPRPKLGVYRYKYLKELLWWKTEIFRAKNDKEAAGKVRELRRYILKHSRVAEYAAITQETLWRGKIERGEFFPKKFVEKI